MASNHNGMDSIGKQMTVGGHSPMDQPADMPVSESEAG
ncbi:MAG: Peptide ABC superfamily ATP binding cassette transporter, permease protein, partial [Actinomyces urogenitalis DORA_12]